MFPALAARGGLAFGADYNPEQWPEHVQVDDIRLMREAGVTAVSLGIFAWGALEPRDGEFDTAWLERVMDRLHAADIRVDLATPTANPPMWLHEKHPEVSLVDAHGRWLERGSRQAWCPASPIYRDYAVRIAGELARRLGGHPSLALWHVGNEIGCHNARCYCPTSAAAFRDWLRRRHGDVDALNASWGTAFWGQYYRSFDEVRPPTPTTASRNPGHLLDFARYSSDLQRATFAAEAEVLRAITPDVPVTTNFMVTEHIDAMDYVPFAREVDVVANDHYLIADDPGSWRELAFCADRTRGLAGGAPWLLMEHSTSQVNWQPRNLAKRPGEMRRNTLAHVARGADGAMFFQWRQSAFGAERFHSAMVPHTGVEGRVWHEVVELGAALRALAPVAGSVTERAPVAMLFDAEAWWTTQVDALPSVDLDYTALGRDLHGAFLDAGIRVDVVAPDADLRGYRAIVVPTLALLRAGHAESLLAAQAAGAHLLVGYFTGVVDEHQHAWLGGYLGPLAPALGVRVDEFAPLAAGHRVTLDDGGTGTVWAERLLVDDAEVLARYVDHGLAGEAAITRCTPSVGGTGWYLSTRPDADALAALVRRFAETADLDPVAVHVGSGLELVRRHDPATGESFLFALNHGDGDGAVTASGVDLLTGETFEGAVPVAAGGVRVVREAR